MRVLIVGNSGSGKSTLAGRLSREHGLAHLDLDTLAWLPTDPPTRRDIGESTQEVLAFTRQHEAWVIEGCYADLVRVLIDDATELVFLNPAVEACVARCLARRWEPHKYPTPEAQAANLSMLVDWVRRYPDRDDAVRWRRTGRCTTRSVDLRGSDESTPGCSRSRPSTAPRSRGTKASPRRCRSRQPPSTPSPASSA